MTGPKPIQPAPGAARHHDAPPDANAHPSKAATEHARGAEDDFKAMLRPAKDDAELAAKLPLERDGRPSGNTQHRPYGHAEDAGQPPRASQEPHRQNPSQPGLTDRVSRSPTHSEHPQPMASTDRAGPEPAVPGAPRSPAPSIGAHPDGPKGDPGPEFAPGPATMGFGRPKQDPSSPAFDPLGVAKAATEPSDIMPKSPMPNVRTGQAFPQPPMPGNYVPPDPKPDGLSETDGLPKTPMPSPRAGQAFPPPPMQGNYVPPAPKPDGLSETDGLPTTPMLNPRAEQAFPPPPPMPGNFAPPVPEPDGLRTADGLPKSQLPAENMDPLAAPFPNPPRQDGDPQRGPRAPDGLAKAVVPPDGSARPPSDVRSVPNPEAVNKPMSQDGVRPKPADGAAPLQEGKAGPRLDGTDVPKPEKLSEAGVRPSKAPTRSDDTDKTATPTDNTPQVTVASQPQQQAFTPTQTVDAVQSPATDVSELADKLADRILVSQPDADTPQVRIRLDDGVLEDTEIILEKDANGLSVRFVTSSYHSAQKLDALSQQLEARLEQKTNEPASVRIEVPDKGDSSDGSSQDGRSRNQRNAQEEAEEDADE